MRHLPERRLRELARFIARTSPAEMDHVEACAECRARMLDLLQGDERLDDARAYTRALARSAAETLACVPRAAAERSAAPRLLAELLSLAPEERPAAVAGDPRFRTYALATWALERCEGTVAHDPRAALELAELARAIARSADPGVPGGPTVLADLETYALALEGDALRAQGELHAAAERFAAARKLQAQGGVDPELAARADALEAALHRDAGQPGRALALLERAIATFLEIDERDLAAGAAIGRAQVQALLGEGDSALETLRRALELPDSARLALCVRHHLIVALAEQGRADEAAALYATTRGLYLQHLDPLTTGRRLWAEGLVHRALADLESAGDLLTEAAARLAEHGYPFEAALAGLDLLAVYARQGEDGEVLRVAAELVKLFRRPEAHPEALATLTQVHRAAERQQVDADLLARAAGRLRHASRVRGAAAH